MSFKDDIEINILQRKATVQMTQVPVVVHGAIPAVVVVVVVVVVFVVDGGRRRQSSRPQRTNGR